MGSLSVVPSPLPHGPHEPVTVTVPRRPGSVRRTTSIDQVRNGPGEPQAITASGRDLVTHADGSTEVGDEVLVTGALDGADVITAIASDPEEPLLDELRGSTVNRGFRLRVDQALPEHRRAATVLHQLLDDLPMAWLISTYGTTREMTDWRMPPEAAERMSDVCAGWASEATMLDILGSTGIFPIPLGPPAPDLSSDDDALAWHDLPEMTPRSIRRRRRIDVWRSDDDAHLEVDAHFRDSHLGLDELEDVLHEYTLRATIDARTMTITASDAEARVLPWPECPGALASAARVVGTELARLRWRVTADLRGTSTCTHLNDTLRSLAGVSSLAGRLP